MVSNAGVQRSLKFLEQTWEEVFEKADKEIDINQRGPLHLSLGLLEQFRSKNIEVIINVSSLLGFAPFNMINPVYNGTKSWMHFFTTNLRTQLKDTHIPGCGNYAADGGHEFASGGGRSVR
ncbi:hypothetical protein B0O99DRAFT_639839 [Bisporella sp. PMI_857]|nr:hypothetical protein B0O99DRAFT_639839 [Bisporella sp. PMI_857]